MNSLIQLFNRLGLQRIAAMAVVAVLMLGFFAFLIMRASTPQMAPLYTGLSFEDSSAIVDELQKQNIPNELRGDGDTILVPRDQITTIRMQLAENGLPTKGQVGYEIFDQQNTLGATSFVQNINNVRALEGELARTISSLALNGAQSGPVTCRIDFTAGGQSVKYQGRCTIPDMAAQAFNGAITYNDQLKRYEIRSVGGTVAGVKRGNALVFTTSNRSMGGTSYSTMTISPASLVVDFSIVDQSHQKTTSRITFSK